MLDHASLGVTNIDRSRRFYDAVLRPLGLVRIVDFGSGRGTPPACPHRQMTPGLSSMGVGSQSLEGAAVVGYARESPGSPRQHGVASRFNVRSARNSFRRPK